MRYLFFSLCIVASLQALGQVENSRRKGTLPTDRPGQTYNATTLQAGVWQLQTAGEVGGFIDSDRGLSYDVFALPIDIRYGITDKLEIMFSTKFNFASTQGTGAGIEYSLTDLQGTLRYSLFDDTPQGSFAFFAGYRHSIYEGGIASGNQGIFKILYAISLGEHLGFSTNLGYTYSQQTGTDGVETTANTFDYTANLAFNIIPEFGIFAEAYGSAGLDDASGSSSWFDAGIFWLLNSDLQLDLFVASGNGDATQNYFTALGLSYRFGEPR
jgi:hypothetical protein